MNCSHDFSRYFLLLAVLFTAVALFAGTVEAQQDPLSPIAPTDMAQCDQLQAEWAARTDELRRAESSCNDQVWNACRASGKQEECVVREECQNCWPLSTSCGSVYATYTRCISFGEAFQCALQNSSAEVQKCRDQVNGYQQRKKQEDEDLQAAQKKAEEQKQEDAKKEQEAQDQQAKAKQEQLDKEKKEKEEKEAKEREEREAAEKAERLKEADKQSQKEQDELAKRIIARNKAIESGKESAKEADKDFNNMVGEKSEHSASIAEDLKNLAQMAQPESENHGSDTHSDSSSFAGTSDYNYDVAGGEHVQGVIDKLIELGQGSTPFASIPFQMVGRLVKADTAMMNEVVTAVDSMDSSFGQRDVVNEFGQKVFDPAFFMKAILLESAGQAANHVLDETVKEPLKENATEIVRDWWYGKGSTNEGPIVRCWWTMKEGSESRMARDEAGTLILYSNYGRGEPYKYYGSRVSYSREEIENLVATTDLRPRIIRPSTWEPNIVVISPVEDQRELPFLMQWSISQAVDATLPEPKEKLDEWLKEEDLRKWLEQYAY